MEFVDDDGQLNKGAIIFISVDKKHDLQQVAEFERGMLEILRDDYGFEIDYWIRWTDGCEAQFRSRFVNSDLMKAKARFDLKRVSFEYFEAHKGKNTSNTIGLLVKGAFLRGMAQRMKGLSVMLKVLLS